MKRKGFFRTYYQNIKELNVSLIVIVVMLFIVVTSFSSYALFGTEVTSNDSISLKVGKPKTPDFCFQVDETGKINEFRCYEGNPYGFAPVTSLVIPKTINNVTITAISDLVFESKNITEVVLPDTLVKIGSYAFNYNEIMSVSIPSNTKTILDGAFANNKLKSVIIEGKSSKNEFTNLGSSIFGWEEGFGDINISYNA